MSKYIGFFLGLTFKYYPKMKYLPLQHTILQLSPSWFSYQPIKQQTFLFVSSSTSHSVSARLLGRGRTTIPQEEENTLKARQSNSGKQVCTHPDPQVPLFLSKPSPITSNSNTYQPCYHTLTALRIEA